MHAHVIIKLYRDWCAWPVAQRWLSVVAVGLGFGAFVVGLHLHTGTGIRRQVSVRPATTPPVSSTSPASLTPAATPGSATPVATVAHTPEYVGVFVSSAPSDDVSLVELDSVARLGANVVYNYDAVDGSDAQVRRYLDHAHNLGVKVIMGVDGLYGPQDDALVRASVQAFQGHPAVWGFGIADEKPETPADSAVWLPRVTARYQLVKSLTAKPVMAIAVGWADADGGNRATFLRSLRPAADVLAVDNYPIPYQHDVDFAALLRDVPTDRQPWSVIQAFSWAAYPDTAAGLGYDLSQARYPTIAEMRSMARQSILGGARSILFYAYFDISQNSTQTAALGEVMHSLR